MFGVAHIEPKDVGARLDHLANDFQTLGGRAEGADDFGLAHRVPEFRAPRANARDIWDRQPADVQRDVALTPGAAFNRRVHPSSFDKMADFVQKYLHSRRQEPLVILDLGSQDFNGSYRSLFEHPPWRYVGIDMEGI